VIEAVFKFWRYVFGVAYKPSSGDLSIFKELEVAFYIYDLEREFALWLMEMMKKCDCDNNPRNCFTHNEKNNAVWIVFRSISGYIVAQSHFVRLYKCAIGIDPSLDSLPLYEASDIHAAFEELGVEYESGGLPVSLLNIIARAS